MQCDAMHCTAHTGGAVFCRHSSKYTILASCLTYSTCGKQSPKVNSSQRMLHESHLHGEPHITMHACIWQQARKRMLGLQ